jgi:hypothetical protein
MTENTSLTGWVVEVTTQGELSRSDGRSNYFNVAIAAANKAEAATTAHLAEEPPREARAVRMLSSRELASLKLQAGQVAAA